MQNEPILSSFISKLQAVLPADAVLTEEADCLPYGCDNSRRMVAPDVVVFPITHQHIKEIIALCNQFKIAVLARGRATATTGATVPVQGGVVISFERMNRIISIDSDNRVAVVEPGVINQDLQDAIKEHGFFWPPDPTSSAYCTVGGNVSCNSAGPRAVKYGTPRENILGLKAVAGDGSDINAGVYTSKGVVGYDLTRLITGSEGTLAVMSELTLKLTPLQEEDRVIKAIYATMESAAQAVAQIMAQPEIPCALEFIDANAIEMIRSYSEVELPHEAGAMLMIEVDGDQTTIDKTLSKVIEAAKVEGIVSLEVAQTQDQAQALWRVRKALSPALKKVAPKKINEDIVVPVSNIPELIHQLNLLSEQYQIKIVNFGHAGNGNIHVNLLINPDDSEEMERAEKCLDRVFDLVLGLKGTISGEHGIGIEKKKFVPREIKPQTLEMMKKVKAIFDPNGILNPGKIF
ncbi:MAG: FAD-binding protein [Gammaproteobacteria bacterium]|nr:MAG: FAD-binding protein [Gammaproteobacteria bacterium]